MQIFQSILVLNGLSKSIALVQKSKNTVLRNFLLIFKWNWQKGANSNILLPHHLLFERGELVAPAL